MKQFVFAGLLAAALLGLAACGGEAGTAQAQQEQTTQAVGTAEDIDREDPAPRGQTEYISAVPEEYFAPSDHPGQVVEITYDSRDYTDTAEPAIPKTAYVYLPYGYDEADQETRYDVLYLMHGWTMTAGDFFDTAQSGIVSMLDHMVENGDIPPVIVVCATFDAQNQSQGFSRSVEELSVFHRDLRENLIPYVESHYHTYAEDVTEEGLRASREHRAFGGFSLGAVTTWYQFIYNLDYIKYFVPMSGDCWIMGNYGGRNYPVETVDYLEQVVADGGWSGDDFYIYQGIGTSDPIWDQTDSQIQEMLTRDLFTADNLHYAIIQGGWHDMGVVVYAPCRRRGYGHEGLALLLRRAFLVCSVSRLHNSFEEERDPGLAIHLRAGFQVVGTSETVRFGRPVQVLELELTKERYLARRQREKVEFPRK